MSSTEDVQTLPPALAGLMFPQMHGRVDNWAVSSETSLAGEIYARSASAGRFGYDEIRDRVRRGRLDGIDPRGLARMARVLAIQLSEPADDDFVIAALRLALRKLPDTASMLKYRKLLVEVLFSRGESAEIRKLLSTHDGLSGEFFGYRVTDACNPRLGGGVGTTDHDSWLARFNRPFAAQGLVPVMVDDTADRPFDTLRAPGAEARPDGPLISVILTTYNPDPLEIQTSLRSILDQTWRNLEVLLIDDCSPETDPQLLEDLARQDPRIRLIRQDRNGGTYRARNAGLRAARGEYVTGQDTDDWSHPERLARQMDRFSGRHDLAGVVTRAIRVDDRLVMTARGLEPDRRCEVSLMVRREDALAIGGYLPVRKAADSEFRERLELCTGKPVSVVGQPLYIIRLSSGSLSRSDFRPGWNHPMRMGFRNAYRHWHATAPQEELTRDRVFSPEQQAFCAPPNMRGKEYTPRRYDLCFVADWRRYSSEVRSALDEIQAAVGAGLTVAVLQLSTPFGGLPASAPVVARLQEEINAGRVGQVYAHGPDSVGTVIVRDPAVIHLGRRGDLGLGAHRVLMVGRTDLSEVADSLKTYDPAYAHRMAQEMFGTTVEWTVPVLEGLEDFAREFSVPVLETAYPLVVDGRWTAHRPMPATTGPGPAIIARRVGTAPEDWPTEEDFSRAYPVDGSVDVRMLGSETSVLTRTGREVLPSSWIVFDEDEIDPVIFWRAVDFMVQMDRRGRSRGHDRDVLEAMAAGTVVIGGPGYDRLYGDRITTAAPEQIANVIADLRQDPEGYLRRATAGQDYVRDEHNAEKFARFVERYAGIEMGMAV